MPEPRPIAHTVGAAARRVGVTVRTLHHWDAIGLASPSARDHSGYRLYSAADLGRLERVAIYRDLGLSLIDIARILDDGSADPVASLRSQQDRVRERIARLRTQEESLGRMAAAHDQGVLLDPEAQREAFGEAWDPSWPAQARERWGNTVQWAQYAERAADRSPEEWAEIAAAAQVVDRRLADALTRGADPASPEADALVREHRAALSAFFPVTVSMHILLGRMYEEGADYAAHYEALAPGLARWLRRAIEATAEREGVDLGAVEWG